MAADLSLKLLESNQYRQVAEWEWGKQENVDWERYEREMNAPQWRHLGLYKDDLFVGAVSFERIDPYTMAYHVVTQRHGVHPQSLAQVLLKSARFFFERGYTKLVVRIPRTNIAAARLALRCGMREDAYADTERHFTLLRHLKHGVY